VRTLVEIGEIVWVKSANCFQRIFRIGKVTLRDDLVIDAYYVGFDDEDETERKSHGYLERTDFIAKEDYPEHA